MVLFAGLRERLALARVPGAFAGAPVAFTPQASVHGFMGFAVGPFVREKGKPMLEAIVSLTALGGSLGVLLGVAAKRLQVDSPAMEGAIAAILPGQNCGRCGYPGCAAAAAALLKGEAPVTVCPVGGRTVAAALAAKLCVDLDLSGVE